MEASKKIEQLKVTSFDDLKKYAEGAIVELPAFAQGQPFVAKLKRPSMLRLVQEGLISNELLDTANNMFISDGSKQMFDETNEGMLDETMRIMKIIARESFVEPTYEQIEQSGIELTDEQLLFVYMYSQLGVRVLAPFRAE